MSRNRCETECPCGLNLATRAGRKPQKDLMSSEEYLKAIGWEDCPYMDFMASCMSRTVFTGWSNRGEPTMFAKVICPLCLVEFVGWFHPPRSPQSDGPEWELYDTSYWSVFNDEPGAEDVARRRDVDDVLKKLNCSPVQVEIGPRAMKSPYLILETMVKALAAYRADALVRARSAVRGAAFAFFDAGLISEEDRLFWCRKADAE